MIRVRDRHAAPIPPSTNTLSFHQSSSTPARHETCSSSLVGGVNLLPSVTLNSRGNVDGQKGGSILDHTCEAPGIAICSPGKGTEQLPGPMPCTAPCRTPNSPSSLEKGQPANITIAVPCHFPTVTAPTEQVPYSIQGGIWSVLQFPVQTSTEKHRAADPRKCQASFSAAYSWFVHSVSGNAYKHICTQGLTHISHTQLRVLKPSLLSIHICASFGSTRARFPSMYTCHIPCTHAHISSPTCKPCALHAPRSTESPVYLFVRSHGAEALTFLSASLPCQPVCYSDIFTVAP